MKTIQFLLCICLGFLGVACSSSFKISSDYDKQANFANYKTYKFTDETNNLPMTELNRRRLLTAASTALAAKGFTPSDNPDVLVNIQANIANKQTATAYNNNYYGSGYAYRWGGGFSTTTINVEDYKEGTLFMDIIDNKNKQLVWQGRGTGVIDDNIDKREGEINKVVNGIM